MLHGKLSRAKTILVIIVFFSLLLAVLWKDIDLGNRGVNVSRWHLVFDDEFNSGILDKRKWNIEDTSPYGYQNCCLGYGVQYFTPKMLSIQSGALHVITQKQKIGDYFYTSGAITTENKFSFLYGRVDIRAKLPKTQGFWPAFWLLPNDSKGIAHYEIDIMELLGNNPRTVYMTNHWGGGGNRQVEGHYIGLDFSQKYHVFSITWNHQKITWYIDGMQCFQVSREISDESMYIIINSSLGGNWPGNPDKTTVLPQSMDIDYVRVYQLTTVASTSSLK